MDKKIINILSLIGVALIIFVLVWMQLKVVDLKDVNINKDRDIEILNKEIYKRDSVIKDLEARSLREIAEQKSGLKIPVRFGPKELEIVFKECAKYKLPVRTVLRLIAAESNFTHNARSYAGAQGYMQIMPATYRAISKRIGTTQHNKYNNLKTGIYYISILYNSFKGHGRHRMRLTILSYNYGIGRVKSDLATFKGAEFDNYRYLVKILGKQNV